MQRLLNTATKIVTILAAVFLVGGLCLSQKSSGPSCLNGTTLNVVAHEDDDILFLYPDIQKDTDSHYCVSTLYLTAGQSNKGLDYALQREAGSRAAYAAMLNSPDEWQAGYSVYNNHRVASFILKSHPQIRLYFLRLPDGNTNGNGFSLFTNQSLQKLKDRKILKISSIDAKNSFSRQDLIATIGSIMVKQKTTLIRTQDFSATTQTDSSDHIMAGFFALSARNQFAKKTPLVSYADYKIINLPINLSPAEISQKRKIWIAYASNDPHVAPIMYSHYGPYYHRAERQYVVDTIPRTYTSPTLPQNPKDPAHAWGN